MEETDLSATPGTANIGIAVVANPHIGYATLAILTGIWLILSGIGTIALGVESVVMFVSG